MATGLIYSDRFLEHDTGRGHPERPDRLRAVVAKLKAANLWDEFVHLPFGPAPIDAIAAVHDRQYLDRVKAACEAGEPFVDVPDSAISAASHEVALLASGGLIAATDAVMAGTVNNAFCAVRPPGHHAESHRSMGFCLFNHVAVAAQHLIRRHGIQRVAIVDWDVHHGNGTQQIFEERSDVLFISMHEHPMHLYPGTGNVWEKGKHKGEGFTLNLPLDPGGGDATYRKVVTEIVEPAVDMFRPEFLLISAGFDAARGDPLAHMEVSPQGFQWMTRRIKTLAEKHCGGRLVSTLEGGYDLRNLAECVALHTSSLMQAEGQDELMAMKAGV